MPCVKFIQLDPDYKRPTRVRLTGNKFYLYNPVHQIIPHDVKVVHLGYGITLPTGYYANLYLDIVNKDPKIVGLIETIRAPGIDEFFLELANGNDEPYPIRRNERIARLEILSVTPPPLVLRPLRYLTNTNW